MGKSFSIDWQGDKELMVKLQRGGGRQMRSDVWKVLKNNAEKGKSIAKSKAPVDTGFLKGQIQTEMSDWPGLTVKIIAGAGYSAYQEYGTRFQPGTPFMRPMLEEINPQFEQDVEEVVKGVFK